MTADFLFSLANPVALLGWIILGVGIVWNKPFLRDVIAGQVFPFGLSVLYTVLIGAFFFKAEGGFDTLPNVMKLFTFPWAALAGWVHYLAFDLFVGAWITAEVLRLSLPRLVLVAVLPLTFLFGPIGLLALFAAKLALHGKEEHS